MIGGMIARLRSLWGSVRGRSALEADMNEEFGLHVELRAQDLERRGMKPREALRRARQEFGSPARYQEEARESRGVHRIDQIRFSLLDFKLGFRMLARVSRADAGWLCCDGGRDRPGDPVFRAGWSIAALLGLNSGSQLFILGLAVAVMMVVGLIACAVPLRRALSIHPTDALRVEG